MNRGPQRRRALESSDDPGSMGIARRCSNHYTPRQPKELLTLDRSQLLLAAWAIANRVQQLEHRHGEPCHVFVSSALKVFVMPESRTQAHQWLREHFGWYLGLYRRRTSCTVKGMPITLDLTLEGIEDDLRHHLRDLGLA